MNLLEYIQIAIYQRVMKQGWIEAKNVANINYSCLTFCGDVLHGEIT
jgi:hypothetical protein